MRPIVLGLLLAAATLLLRDASFMQTFERRLLDYRYCARESLFHATAPISPDIAIILQDDATYQAPKLRDIPPSLWSPLYSKLTADVLAAGADTIGIDMTLVSYDPRYYQVAFGNQDDPYSAMAEALDSHPHRIVVGAYVQNRALSLPAAEVALLVGYDNVALLNTTGDADDVDRFQYVDPIAVPPQTRLGDEAWGRSSMMYFAPLLARLKGADAGPSGFMYINYAGQNLAGACPFPTYSLSDVLTWPPEQLQQCFAHKVVLFGTGSLGDNDVHLTPFTVANHHNMLGIVVQANIVNTLLTRQFIRPASWGLDLAVALCFGLAMALCTQRFFMVQGLLALAAIEVMVLFSSAAAFAWGGWYLHTAPVLVGVLLVAAVLYGMRFRLVWSMFSRYVSSSLLQHTALLELGTASRRKVTVLFTDINSFSTTCERHTPDEIIRMLNHYFEAMNEIIVQSGGWIKQFVGDEIMVIYGAPDAHPRPEHAAVETALHMMDCLAKMRAATQDDGFFEIKAGIHSGEVIVGNVGSRHRTEYAAVGDDVNLGSRIMGMTKGLHATTLISEATYQIVRDMPGVEFTDHGPQPVKGRQEMVRVYAIKRVT